MIAQYLSKQMINGKIPLLIKLIIMVMVIKRNILSKKIGKFKNYKNIEGLGYFNIDIDAFNFNKRKNGISLFGRFKNSSDFLEQSIESQINLVDEIILVDNNSTDNTKEICIRMKNKYPKKIKFYEYNIDLCVLGDDNWAITPNNSVSAMSYYYNWTMSKTTYKYVAKLDDDIIIYDYNLVKNIFNKIKQNGINYLQIIPQLNVNYINGEIMTPISQPYSKVLPPIAGLYLDHGVFPISENTYFINDKKMETFIFSFSCKISPIGFIHLKGMKGEIKNWKGNMKKMVDNITKKSIYISLPNKFKSAMNFLNQ